MTFQEALRRFLVQLEADGRSIHTRKQYRRHVRALHGWLGNKAELSAVTHEQIAAFLSEVAVEKLPGGGIKRARTMNAMRSSLKGFFHYLHQAGTIDRNPMRLVRRARCGAAPPKALSKAEQDRLLDVLAKAPDRDQMLFSLMLRCGLRIGSALGLDVDDVDSGRGELRLRTTKGNYEETVPLPRSISDGVRRFIADRYDEPLFISRAGKRISIRHAQRLFARYAAQAGIRTTSTHSLRHSFATDLYQRTGDVMLVQRALRHRSIESTMTYARLDDRRLREVMGA